mmetsp:Transcript_47992/g.133884  ORF Transcript_47992/g.133884 Transcript_47992/m.133884 type:complete len:326 (-) Transcript_47992:269-1246(-)
MTESDPDVDAPWDDDFGDFGDWEQRWENEFKRFNEAEDERLERAASLVGRVVGKEADAYKVAVEAAVREGDVHAKQISRLAAEVARMEQEFAAAEIQETAAQNRNDICKTALDSASDLANQIQERSAQRRKEREARRLEEKRAREAAAEEKWRKNRQEEAAGAFSEERRRSSATGNASGRGPSCGPEPRFTRKPGAHAAGEKATAEKAGAGSTVPVAASFESFAAFDAAWAAFERRVADEATAARGATLGCADVPWPTSLPTISGILPTDKSKDRKRKLREAVLRWHPDKWMPILAHIREADRQEVMERVKAVTRRILDERKRFA